MLFTIPLLMYWDMIVVEYDSPVFVEQMDSGLPESFIQYQNYPNPFNPTTQIKYSVKEDGFVTMKVYDVLGKEVAVLVNDEKLTATYTVNFDASMLSSGIYFYTITAKDFHQTKKMLLIK